MLSLSPNAATCFHGAPRTDAHETSACCPCLIYNILLSKQHLLILSVPSPGTPVLPHVWWGIQSTWRVSSALKPYPSRLSAHCSLGTSHLLSVSPVSCPHSGSPPPYHSDHSFPSGVRSGHWPVRHCDTAPCWLTYDSSWPGSGQTQLILDESPRPPSGLPHAARTTQHQPALPQCTCCPKPPHTPGLGPGLSRPPVHGQTATVTVP